MDISDGDLVRLARDGDPAALRLLVERYQAMMRARAAGLSRNRSDVDDIVQESFLQAFVALDRLRDPDRFAGWLAAIVLNVSRNLQRHAQPVLLPEWPEPLHPAAPDAVPKRDPPGPGTARRTAAHQDLRTRRRCVRPTRCQCCAPDGGLSAMPAEAHCNRLRRAAGRSPPWPG